MEAWEQEGRGCRFGRAGICLDWEADSMVGEAGVAGCMLH